MWSISFADQTLTFFLSLLFGAVLCLLYDLFRLFRLSHKPSAPGIFLQDVLYFVLCGFLTYCFFIVRCSGEIRGYVLLGELLGFLACRCTLSAVLLWLARHIYRILRRIFRVLLRPLRAAVLFLRKKWTPVYAFLRKIPYFGVKTAKKLLKGSGHLVYNLSNGKNRRRRKVQAEADSPSD